MSRDKPLRQQISELEGTIAEMTFVQESLRLDSLIAIRERDEAQAAEKKAQFLLDAVLEKAAREQTENAIVVPAAEDDGGEG